MDPPSAPPVLATGPPSSPFATAVEIELTFRSDDLATFSSADVRGALCTALAALLGVAEHRLSLRVLAGSVVVVVAVAERSSPEEPPAKEAASAFVDMAPAQLSAQLQLSLAGTASVDLTLEGKPRLVLSGSMQPPPSPPRQMPPPQALLPTLL